MTALTDFDAKLEAVKELVNVKFDAQNETIHRMAQVLDRVVIAVERQAEQNIAIAVLTTRVNHLDEGLNSHKTAVNAALNSHGKRIGDVESTSTKTSWRLASCVSGATVVGGGAIAAISSHLGPIARFLFGGG